MTMPQQVPQISILPTWHPDPREAIFQHQSQNQLRILAIRLLLPHPLRADLGGVPDPQLKPQLRDQSLKPASLPAGFHSHPHLYSLCPEIAVELLCFFSMRQSPFRELARVRVHVCNLLKPRVVIHSYNDHCSAPFSRAFWLVGTTKVYPGVGARHCHGIITLIVVNESNRLDFNN